MRSPENSSFHGNTSSASIEHCLNTEHRLDGQNDRAVTDRRHLTERCAPVENCPAIKFTLSIASRARGKIKRRANKSDLRWSGEVRPLVVAAVPRFVTKLRMLPRSHSIYNVLGILTYADPDGRQPNDSSVSPAEKKPTVRIGLEAIWRCCFNFPSATARQPG